jgi:hypothetical protein
MNLTALKTWVSGETLTATDLNGEFQNIYTHTITNSDIDSTGTYVLGELVVGSGITAADGGQFHVHTASAGSVQAHADANEAVLENSAASGLSILSGSSSDGNIFFGDAADNDVGKIAYSHSANSLAFTTNGATALTLSSAQAATFAGDVSVGGALTLTGGLTLNGAVVVGDSASDTLTVNATVTSDLLFTDSTYDIGKSGATRPRDGFFSRNMAVGGTLGVTGLITATGGVSGALTGNVTGNVTGDLTGNVTGNVTGNLTGDVTGNISGNVTGGTISGTTGTFSGDLTVDTSTLKVDSSNNRVGVLCTNPNYPFTVQTSSNHRFFIRDSSTSAGSEIQLQAGNDADSATTNLKLSASRYFLENGNVGIGLTPSAWGGSFKALQVNDSVFYNNNGGDTFVGSNYYYDGTNNKYINTDYSAAYGQQAGAHIFYTAPSGTAGNTVSFTQAMTLTNAGLLGLGTASPSRGLHLKGDSSTSAIRLETTGGEWEVAPFYSTFTDGNFAINRIAGSGNVLIPSGNVGIGTSSPTTLLELNSSTGPEITIQRSDTSIAVSDVVGGIRFSSNDSSTAFGSPPHYGAGIKVKSAGTVGLQNMFFYAGQNNMGYENDTPSMQLVQNGDVVFYNLSPGGGMTWDASASRLGIGTSSPERVLDIVQSGDASMRLKAGTTSNNSYVFYENSTGGIFHIGKYGTARTDVKYGQTLGGCSLINDADTASNGLVIGTQSSSAPVIFGVGNQERARIHSDGIFTLSSNTNSYGTTGWYGVAADTGNGSINISRNGSNVAAFFHTSNANGINGSAVGTISITTTSTAYNTSSDYRLKENVVGITDGITRIKSLKPSRFNFISNADQTVDGFVAHEVSDVVPEAITGAKDAVDDEGNPEYQGIDQSKLVPLLTAALQEAITKIETLETKVAALEAA